MKYRKSFVTNSSSSSFILSFKNKKEFEEFEEYCNDFNYTEVFNLITKCMLEYDDEDELVAKNIEEVKKEAIEWLEHCYTFEDKRKFLNEKVGQISDFRERIEKEKEIEASEEYIEFIRQSLMNPELQKKIEEIKNNQITITGTIWDTNGGLLEWSIRNGFLEREFPQWVKNVWNVG